MIIMIIINGATGSGKSSIVRELIKIGYEVIPTYSTRPKRPDDFDTIHVDLVKVNQMMNELRVLSQISYQAKFGYCKYFLLEKSFKTDLSNKVIIGNAQFTPDIEEYMRKKCEPLFRVCLDVPDKVILNRDMQKLEKKKSLIDKIIDFFKYNKEPEMPPEVLDRMDRLERDKMVIEKFKRDCDLLIAGKIMIKYSPLILASYIDTNYHKFLESLWKTL